MASKTSKTEDLQEEKAQFFLKSAGLDDQQRTKLFQGSINPSAGKTIDERMADLLADHKRMGAR